MTTVRPNYDDELVKCRKFLEEFQTEDDDRPKYVDLLQRIANREETMIEISLDEVAKYTGNLDFALSVQHNTKRYVDLFSRAVDELLPAPTIPLRNRDVFDVLLQFRTQSVVTGDDVPQEKPLPAELRRRYELYILPLTDAKPVSLRSVDANSVGHLVTVRALVIRVTEVKPMATVVAYTCGACGSEIYQSITAPTFMPTAKCESRQCAGQTNSLQMQSRGTKFVKLQEIRMQELPDQVPVGHVPRMMKAFLRGDRTRNVGPGDRVILSGIFLSVQHMTSQDSYIEAMAVEKIGRGQKDLSINAGLATEIQKAAESPGIYDRLATSIAPEIFGHLDVKKSLLLQLVGGPPISLRDGMRIRGDLHICLMGDPGVAKSQLLRHIIASAPRGVYTTGKGSSGVGLTAAVIRDPTTGETVLEGGALVLADLGICAIDEFDKMEEGDRTAIHEVMEQQTVSIAKAGVTASLNARTAVLAAANPTYGRYNFKKSPSENINLPQALLSRFDLLFLLIDDPSRDQVAFARHVTHVHLHLRPPEREGEEVYSPTFLRAYIQAAKQVHPRIPPGLAEYVVGAYVGMRNDEQGDREQNYFYTTPRTLLSVLRLACALARLRFNPEVAREDVDEAMRLMYVCRASIYDTQPTTAHVEDVTGAVYHIIRDYAVSNRTQSVALSAVQGRFAAKNILADQVEEALREYSELNVWVVSSGTVRFIDPPTAN